MTPDIKQTLASIRLVAFDVDGVLTDGKLYYGADGEALKVFHVRDGVGMKLLADHGIAVAVVSAKDSPMLARRMRDLGIQHYFPGCRDKLQCVRELSQELAIAMNQTVFIGDDMVDLKVMAECGLGIAPLDAYPVVRDQADWVLSSRGGEGVAREVADLILNAQNQYDDAYSLAATPGFERKR
ncbi:3-deoxy-manno-octulosonate-8-phosphatase [Saccharospirillum sp. MSK14-1]|uniref:KdsC family phosphatase n=1 Tax=Saccharospirillum sp. MSK14-1 TaxID=1897632 RepID=UPI000D3957AB|nr:HAD-IIIA family hydrolase [Saccharospirillum sp. MSK14-1]PTY36653.1 3-deoxy-manno-octulosonate-8-phosphatase [Saccharospirillum sp. MSK14-1]